MLMPSLFNDNFNFMDRFYNDPWFAFDDHDFRDMEKKLYGHRAKNVMNTDIKEEENGYELTIDLPGFKKDEVTIDLQKGYLVVSASKNLEKNDAESEEEAAKGRYIRRERYTGSCQRSFYVGDALEHEDVKARFEHGILTIDIPKKDPNRIENRRYIAIEG